MGVFGPSVEGVLPGGGGVGQGLHWSCPLVLCWPISMRFLSERSSCWEREGAGLYCQSQPALACTVNPSRHWALYCRSQGRVVELVALRWFWFYWVSIRFLHIVTGGSD